MMALFRPSPQTQLPVMRAAIKSLKLAEALGDDDLVEDGCIIKANREKDGYNAAYREHADSLNEEGADFDIHRLTMQMQHECVFPTGFGPGRGEIDESRWGKPDESRIGNCIPLIGRVDVIISTVEFACVFDPGDKPTFAVQLKTFLESDDKSILRISLKYLSFKHSLREVIVNSIGRTLLSMARAGAFVDRPVVAVLDEAHQFLNRSLGEEHDRYPLDAFELIAKEGRKYGLTLTLATQRPRDVPEGVISQVGTLIVHRLTNGHDRDIVSKAAGEIDKSAIAFLPTLAPGEAVLLGVDFVVPMIVRIDEPVQKPDSAGPDYQKHWKKKKKPKVKK
jgi:hypothetical protein